MSNAILTPVTLWKNSDAVLPPEAVAADRMSCDGIVWEKVRFSGREISGERVSVAGVYACREDGAVSASLLFLPDLGKKEDKALMEKFAKEGFGVLSIEYAGSALPEGTHYPDGAGDAKSFEPTLEGDASDTPYYEWGCTARYGVRFLKEKNPGKRVGVYGSGVGGDIAWYLSAMEGEVDCAATAFSVGWRAYAKFFRFGEHPDPDFDEGNYRYLAAIDVQAYAQYVKCPVLMMTSTNHALCDCDRAADTLARISPEIPAALYLSVNADCYLDNKALKDLELFSMNALFPGQEPLFGPSDITLEQADDSVLVCVSADRNPVEKVKVHTASNETNPALRCWELVPLQFREGNRYYFRLYPEKGIKKLFFFAEISYLNGFTASTKIAAKSVEPEHPVSSGSRLIYNNKCSEDLFIPYYQTGIMYGDTFLSQNGNAVCVRTGPMDIAGAYGEGGLKTYKINEIKELLTENSILLMDVYASEKSSVLVELVCSADTEKETHYYADGKIPGGETWHSLKFFFNRFKTEEGRLLRTPNLVNLLILHIDGEYLVNNILWL